LTIENATEDVDFVKFLVEEQEANQRIFSLPELMILRYLVDNKRIRLAKAQEIAQIRKDETQGSIRNLVKIGLLETVGNEYMLTAKVYDAIKSDVEYTQDRLVRYIRAKEMVLDFLKRNEFITNEKIQELCGYTREQARKTIEKLCDESVLVRQGGGRGTRYYLAR
jgi:ATP-dependent DNA helicase RecG